MSAQDRPGGDGTGRFTLLVAAGILLSRIAGLIRDRVFAHYFGNSDAADAFKAAFRIPNFLQNLFGEGVLSASFIPVYAGLMANGEQEEARRVAGGVAALLSLVIAPLVLVGVQLTPYLIDVITPGFEGEKRELTIRLVRILFPGAGLLVIAAWCLGILNSHGRFFLSYAAPIVWNFAIIVALIGLGGRLDQYPLAEAAAWGAVAGSALQLGVQLPVVLYLLRRLRFSLGRASAGVRAVVVNFVPAFASRGVVQISAYVDALLASLLPTGAVAALSYAQTLYLLPVSLFGMSVSAAELPAMSSAQGDEREVAAHLRERLNTGLHRIAFFVTPSAMAFLALGDIVAGAVYQTGHFTRADAIYVWGILAGAAVGLVAATLGRLYASAYYALRDTRTPLRYAILRVLLASALGYSLAIPLPPLIDVEARWGVVGLTVSASIAAWIEFALLRHSLNRVIGKTGARAGVMLRLWGAAGAAAVAAWAIKLALGPRHPVVVAVVVLGSYGGLFFALTAILGVAEARAIWRRLSRLIIRNATSGLTRP